MFFLAAHKLIGAASSFSVLLLLVVARPLANRCADGATNWQKGATGEEAVGVTLNELRREGWVLLHDIKPTTRCQGRRSAFATLPALLGRQTRALLIGLPLIAALVLSGVVGCGSAQAGSTERANGRAATSRSATRVAFPLHVIRGRRYLVDSKGKPFLIVGDAAWSLIVQLKDADLDRYLQARRKEGFNTLLVNLIEHKFAVNAPADAYGDAPFTTPGDFGTPNKRYFQHAVAVVKKARAQGMLVLLAPAYLGYAGGDEGWWQDLKANGVAKLRQYGRYVGSLFRKLDNVVWVEGGDFDPPTDERKLVDAVAQGIRSVDGGALQTFHGSRQTSALAYWQPKPAWLSVNAIYTNDSTVVLHARKEYGRSTMPFFLIEGIYEYEGTFAAGVRQQAYQAILSGSTGSMMGNTFIWPFRPGWQAQLDSPGSKSMTQLGTFFRSLPWWKLQPDWRHRLVVNPTGNGSTALVAARASDGSTAVVYTPTPRKLTVDLSRLRGPLVSVQWFDPVSGQLSVVAGSPFKASGRHVFATPATNAGGDGDFVLLLRSRSS